MPEKNIFRTEGDKVYDIVLVKITCANGFVNCMRSIKQEWWLDWSMVKKQHQPQTKKLKMGSDSNPTQVVRSSTMLLSCRVQSTPARCGKAPPKQIIWTRHWTKLVWSQQTPTVCPYSPESRHQTLGAGWQVVLSGHVKLRTKDTHSMDISEWCHAWNHGRALSNALSPSRRRRKLLAWSCGVNDSSPWTPVCTLTSVLKNTSQLAQRSPGQPGRHSTGCVYTCWPVKSEHVKVGIFKRSWNVWLWHQADHATSTGLPHDEHCLLYPRPDNG